MKILVIDDEEMIRGLSKRILEKAGFEVLLAENGQKGIDIFMEHIDSIPLILVDMNMEGISGIDTIQHIWEKSKGTFFIISSGNKYNIKELSPEIQPKVTFLEKPYRAKQLSKLVKSLLASV